MLARQTILSPDRRYPPIVKRVQSREVADPYRSVPRSQDGLDPIRLQALAGRKTGDLEVAKSIEPPRSHGPHISFIVLIETIYSFARKPIGASEMIDRPIVNTVESFSRGPNPQSLFAVKE